jgi:putative Mg2+ transporter-C (MgtC) family protein
VHPGGANVTVDPARVAYGVMTGIGFIGAGTIIHAQGNVRGLTTGAALWCVAAMGLAIGFGLYVIAMTALLLLLAALWWLDYVEESLPRRVTRIVTIRCPWAEGCVRETSKLFTTHGLRVSGVQFHRLGDLSQVDIRLTVEMYRKHDYQQFEHAVQQNGRLVVVSVES